MFGGGPGLFEPWSDPAIETCVRASDVFWSEVPEIGADAQALAIKYGVDPAAPLATWMSASDCRRIESAAVALELAPQMIAAVRPWLAAQLLRMASDVRLGLVGEYSAEQHLRNVARRAGVALRSEFPEGEALFAAFASWPRQAEIERLLSTLDEIDSGAEGVHEQAKAWLADDLRLAEQIDERYRTSYPALYGHLVIGRNRAWVSRITSMLREPAIAFICVGTGHLVGPQGVPVLLEEAGIRIRRG
jgi:uncharacterized protein YbaP (TraB family)